MSIEARLAELGHTLPAAAAPVASYVSAVQTPGLLHVSGQISIDADGALLLGTLGAGLDVAAGQYAAQRCALSILAQIKAALGTFERIERIVKLGVFIAATPDFTQHPEVANGASDLFVAALGEAGKHARSAVGVASLPRGVAVEVDAIILTK